MLSTSLGPCTSIFLDVGLQQYRYSHFKAPRQIKAFRDLGKRIKHDVCLLQLVMAFSKLFPQRGVLPREPIDV
jgi:hypothetical protein